MGIPQNSCAIFRRHEHVDHRRRHARHDAADGIASDDAPLRRIFEERPAVRGAILRPRLWLEDHFQERTRLGSDAAGVRGGGEGVGRSRGHSSSRASRREEVDDFAAERIRRYGAQKRVFGISEVSEAHLHFGQRRSSSWAGGERELRIRRYCQRGHWRDL